MEWSEVSTQEARRPEGESRRDTLGEIGNLGFQAKHKHPADDPQRGRRSPRGNTNETAASPEITRPPGVRVFIVAKKPINVGGAKGHRERDGK